MWWVEDLKDNRGESLKEDPAQAAGGQAGGGLGGETERWRQQWRQPAAGRQAQPGTGAGGVFFSQGTRSLWPGPSTEAQHREPLGHPTLLRLSLPPAPLHSPLPPPYLSTSFAPSRPPRVSQLSILPSPPLPGSPCPQHAFPVGAEGLRTPGPLPQPGQGPGSRGEGERGQPPPPAGPPLPHFS
ncbi:uncharacterized protein LOC131380982 [Hylobates moloch]|uniref:uncharacterized protein LOC131380982 n=1 Tax=Hylobates moloch TaxID=81572 RepID=UPI002674D583|nr:uncharacterized protein LOC131380982 [Hylobates moloch]